MSRALNTQDPNPTRLFAAWILFAVFCHLSGWLLSAAHALNRLGYTIALVTTAVVIALWWVRNKSSIHPPNLARFKRRFRRPFPLGFLILATLATIGGFLYAPTNFDDLAFRSPRVLHWLAAEHMP